MFPVGAAHGILGGAAGEVPCFLERLRATRVTIEADVFALDAAKCVTCCGFLGGAARVSR